MNTGNKIFLSSKHKRLGDRIIQLSYIFNLIEKTNKEYVIYYEKMDDVLTYLLRVLEPPKIGKYIVERGKEGIDISLNCNIVSRYNQYRNIDNLDLSTFDEDIGGLYFTWQVFDGNSASSKNIKSDKSIKYFEDLYNYYSSMLPIKNIERTNPKGFKDFSNRVFLIKHSVAHIGIDSGMMHIAFCLGKKVLLHRISNNLPKNYLNIYKNNNCMYFKSYEIPNIEMLHDKNYKI